MISQWCGDSLDHLLKVFRKIPGKTSGTVQSTYVNLTLCLGGNGEE